MFHTILLFQSIDAFDYTNLKACLSQLSKEKNSRHFTNPNHTNERIYELYKGHGIIIILRCARKPNRPRSNNIQGNINQDSQGINYHAIEIRLNPKVLIQANEYVEVARESDFSEICDQFKKVLKPLQKKFEASPSKNIYRFNKLEEYQVNRIDYCINIRSTMHKELIELIRRAEIPARFSPVTKSDKKSGREVAYKNSFYIQTQNHSVVVNFYNKEHQMYNEFESYERLNDASNIIRLEIQCQKGKTNSLKQKFKWKYRDLINFANDDIARKLIYYYYEKTVGFEDYYTLNEAKRRVKSCDNHRKKTIDKMIEILELVNQKRSIYQALLSYSDNLEDRDDVAEFNSIIKKIRKSGVNPVTIPINWGYSHIPNLVEEMDKEFTQLLRVVID
ncbi:Replication initiation factor [compost metagenome]